LRERKEDVPLLVEHFLQRLNPKMSKNISVPAETMDWLCKYDWPGNVRELENAVERAVTLNIGGKLLPEDFMQFTPTPITQTVVQEPVAANGVKAIPTSTSTFWVCELPQTLEEVERQHIMAMLRFMKGNKLRTSEMLGIGRYSLYRKAERLGIDLSKES
ncbi:MAG: helix-turn-helix domain-containing protein, partial [Acidobacteriota bacterium]